MYRSIHKRRGAWARADTVAAEVEQYINSQPELSIKKILVPVKDKRKLREVLEEHEITSVINIARSRAADTLDPDYASRRAAVDFGIPVSPAPSTCDLPASGHGMPRRKQEC